MSLNFPDVLPAPGFFLGKISQCKPGEVPDFFECEKIKRHASSEANKREVESQDTMQREAKELPLDKEETQAQILAADEAQEEYLGFAIEDDEIPPDNEPGEYPADEVKKKTEETLDEEYLGVQDEQVALENDEGNSLDKDIDAEYFSISAEPEKNEPEQFEKKTPALKSPQLRARVFALLQRHEMKSTQDEDTAETPGLIIDMPQALVETPLEVIKGKGENEELPSETSIAQKQKNSFEELPDEEIESIEELPDEEIESIEELPDEEIESIEKPDEGKNGKALEKAVDLPESIEKNMEAESKEQPKEITIARLSGKYPKKYDCLVFKDDPKKGCRILGKCEKEDGFDYLVFSQKSGKKKWLWLFLLLLASASVALYKFAPELFDKLTRGVFP